MSIIAKHKVNLRQAEDKLMKIRSAIQGKKEEERELKKIIKKLEAERPDLLAKIAMHEASPGEASLVLQDIDNSQEWLAFIPETICALRIRERNIQTRIAILRKKIRWEEANRQYDELKRKLESTDPPPYDKSTEGTLLKIGTEVGKLAEATEIVKKWGDCV